MFVCFDCYLLWGYRVGHLAESGCELEDRRLEKFPSKYRYHGMVPSDARNLPGFPWPDMFFYSGHRLLKRPTFGGSAVAAVVVADGPAAYEPAAYDFVVVAAAVELPYTGHAQF